MLLICLTNVEALDRKVSTAASRFFTEMLFLLLKLHAFSICALSRLLLVNSLFVLLLGWILKLIFIIIITCYRG